MNIWNTAILPMVAGLAISYFSTPLAIKFAEKIGIIDDPKKNKHPKVLHTYPVPRGGGIPLFLGIFIPSLVFLPIDKHLIGILLGALVLTIVGILDDKYNISPYKRLLIQFLVAGIPIAAGIGIAYFRLPQLAEFISQNQFLNQIISIDPNKEIIDLSQPRIYFDFFGTHSIWILSDLFAIFWIVTLMNFVNMGASGLDGQLSGTTAVSAFVIAILSLKYDADIAQWPVIILAMVVSGSFLGFLPWHKYPQKIMPGFGGSTLAGYMLSVLSILSTTKVGTLMVILAVPLIDTGYTVLRRILSGKSPFWGDRGHLHHKLLDLGFSKKQVAFFYWTSTALLGILALNLNAENKFYTILGVSIFLGGFLLWLAKKKK